MVKPLEYVHRLHGGRGVALAQGRTEVAAA